MSRPVLGTTLPARELARALNQVLPAVGADPREPHLMGVLIEGKAGSLRLAATDSSRLMVRDVVPSKAGPAFRAVVAGATLARWQQSLMADTEVAVGVGGDRLMVSGDGVDLEAPILPTSFPDYEYLLVSPPAAATVTIDRLRLLHGFESFESFESPEENCAVLATTSPRALTLTRGDVAIELEAHCDGADQQVALNPGYGAEAVGNVLTAEVIVELNGPFRPVFFQSAGDGTYTSLLMPVMV